MLSRRGLLCRECKVNEDRLFEGIIKRFDKLERHTMGLASESPNSPFVGGDLELDYRIYSDLTTLILEMICAVLGNSLIHNPQLGMSLEIL